MMLSQNSPGGKGYASSRKLLMGLQVFFISYCLDLADLFYIIQNINERSSNDRKGCLLSGS